MNTLASKALQKDDPPPIGSLIETGTDIIPIKQKNWLHAHSSYW